MSADHSTDIQKFAEEYFAAAIDIDRDRYLMLFSDEVVVHDDGQTHRGLAGVRGWRSEVPPVDYNLCEVTGTPAACVAAAEVSGDFPGSPITLRFAFRRDRQGKITTLDIKPWDDDTVIQRDGKPEWLTQ
jgi:hypothetical protein